MFPARLRPAEMWLTTYAHLAWNAPFYQRFGFETMADAACGPEIREVLAAQRAVLPERSSAWGCACGCNGG